MVVDRSSHIPVELSNGQQIEAAILSGQLPIGERLENEVALADSFGMSRPTVRTGMGHLVDKRLLVRRRGAAAGSRYSLRPSDLPSVATPPRTSDTTSTTQATARSSDVEQVEGGLDDGACVEGVVAVDVGEAAGLPELLHA